MVEVGYRPLRLGVVVEARSCLEAAEAPLHREVAKVRSHPGEAGEPSHRAEEVEEIREEALGQQQLCS